MAEASYCAQGCSGCSHGKPMFRLERVQHTHEKYKELYDMFYKYNLKPFGMKENGEGDGYEIVAAFAMKSIQSRRNCPAGVETPEKGQGPVEKLCGGMTLTKHDGKYYIGGVALIEEVRGKQLGGMLLKKTVEEAKKLGADILYVLCPVNPDFYRSVGFDWEEGSNTTLIKKL